MVKIIPAIIAKNYLSLKEKINLTEKFSPCSLMQIDIMNNTFVKNKTVNFATLKKIKTNLKFEFHFMINNPEKSIKKWLQLSPQNIYFHLETSNKINELIKLVKKNKIKIGLAINPETSVELLKPYLNSIDSVLLLSVNPGFYASPFQKNIYQKIKNLKKIAPQMTIAVDGGINTKNIKNLISAGATKLCIGSNIYQTTNPIKAYQEFQKLI